MDASSITRVARIIQDAAQAGGPAREEASRAAMILLTEALPLWLFPTLFLGGLLLQTAALFFASPPVAGGGRRPCSVRGHSGQGYHSGRGPGGGLYWSARSRQAKTLISCPTCDAETQKTPAKAGVFCVLDRSAYLKAFSKLGTTCFLRLITPGSHTELPSAFTPKAFSTTPGSSETISISEPSFMMSVSSRKTL